jgi:signal transduction histidine kinase
MMARGEFIGGLIVTRPAVGIFSAHEVELLTTFADQAVIAIENVRLFNETKEALEHQRTSAEILAVIGSSVADTKPVFDKIAESSAHLFSGRHVGIILLGEDRMIRLAAHRGPQGDELAKIFPAAVAHGSSAAEVILGKRLMQYPDVLGDPSVPERTRAACELTGARAIMYAPMVSRNAGIGMIYVARETVGAFRDKELALLKTFADQAVIAIENVRLFNETKEALERQTATAEILKVISGSPTDVQPVFDAIVRSAARLFDPCDATITMLENGFLQWNATAGMHYEQKDVDKVKDVYPLPFDPSRSPSSRAIQEGRIIEIMDAAAPDAPDFTRRVGQAGGFRSACFVPLIRENEGIGTIILTHPEPGYKLSDEQLALVQTFADQAVIAIENVRLFKELEARTEALTRSVGQLTALGEVGQAISSTLDLETVLQTIVTRAVQLTGLDGGSIYEYDESREEFRLQAAENMTPDIAEDIRKAPTRKGDGALGRTALTLEPTQVSDTLDESYQSGRKELLVRAGTRALLAVPLLREGHLLGAILVNRRTPGPFAPEVVELLKTFASQSAMAIQNARLFREIAEKGKQLELASQHKSNFLASMSHELRTPLNAILGFNEMILDRVYGEVSPDVQAPLENIQTSGKHLLRLINNVLDLAKIEAGRMELSLQDYSVHDAVASVQSILRPLAVEKGLEFLATLPDDLPLAYGDSGRIAQCLMNLAGNSIKFTKAGKVEISVVEKDGLLTYRVTDTGVGIPPDKIDSLFTEFKQTDATIASEYGGTGLGLSISRKFVEMHGGRIWVESELGKGSAFIIEIPLRVKTT